MYDENRLRILLLSVVLLIQTMDHGISVVSTIGMGNFTRITMVWIGTLHTEDTTTAPPPPPLCRRTDCHPCSICSCIYLVNHRLWIADSGLWRSTILFNFTLHLISINVADRLKQSYPTIITHKYASIDE